MFILTTVYVHNNLFFKLSDRCTSAERAPRSFINHVALYFLGTNKSIYKRKFLQLMAKLAQPYRKEHKSDLFVNSRTAERKGKLRYGIFHGINLHPSPNIAQIIEKTVMFTKRLAIFWTHP